MPIKDKSIYPADWKEISEYLRFVRAENKCELCGAENYKPHPITGSKVVLAVMHLDHDPANTPSLEVIKAGGPGSEMLIVGCQKCHNSYDALVRAANRSVVPLGVGHDIMTQCEKEIKKIFLKHQKKMIEIFGDDS